MALDLLELSDLSRVLCAGVAGGGWKCMPVCQHSRANPRKYGSRTREHAHNHPPLACVSFTASAARTLWRTASSFGGSICLPTSSESIRRVASTLHAMLLGQDGPAQPCVYKFARYIPSMSTPHTPWALHWGVKRKGGTLHNLASPPLAFTASSHSKEPAPPWLGATVKQRTCNECRSLGGRRDLALQVSTATAKFNYRTRLRMRSRAGSAVQRPCCEP